MRGFHIFAVVCVALGAVGCGDDNGGADGLVLTAPPANVMVALNITADDSAGTAARAMIVMDLDTGMKWIFPLASMDVAGQPMHAGVSPDRTKAWVTLGGDATLAHRVVSFALNWTSTGPMPAVVATKESLPANTPNNKATAEQAGHGIRMSNDGRYMYFTHLLNNELRVYDTETNAFVGSPTGHASLLTPHGFYPNPAGTLGMSNQYRFDGPDISLWTIGSGGTLTFVRTIALVDANNSAIKGQYTHTAFWLDNTRFVTNVTQEPSQGTPNTSEQSVWVVDTSTNTARAIIRKATTTAQNASDGVLEGVSDTWVANGKLYVCEGNVEKTDPPGHVSIWTFNPTTLAVTFVKRLSAGAGLPADFRDCHELDGTSDGKKVIVASFRSNHMATIDTTTDTATTLGSSDGLVLFHGLFIQPR